MLSPHGRRALAEIELQLRSNAPDLVRRFERFDTRRRRVLVIAHAAPFAGQGSRRTSCC